MVLDTLRIATRRGFVDAKGKQEALYDLVRCRLEAANASPAGVRNTPR